MGIAVYSDSLYIISSRCDTIGVYQTTEPYTLRENIQIPKLNPSDVVAFNEQRCLYVTDPFKRCVWLLEPEESHQFRRFLQGINAWTLFVDRHRKRLLVTSPCSLYIYDIDGKQEKNIALPAYMDAVHSVVTPEGRFLVCHTSQTGNNYHQVSEIDSDGTVTRVYGGSKGSNIDELSNPAYIELDDRGSLFIADCNNSRILLFDARRLQLRRIVLEKDDDELNLPRRVRYLPREGRLLVGMNDGAVNIYSLLTSKMQRPATR
jgi:hypothetical protein